MKPVLVIGGYGGFGARAVELLGKQGHIVWVAGRSFGKAEAFCASLPDLRLRPMAIDRSRDLSAVLATEQPWLVVDAAGPFQDADYGVPEACIAAGCHYLDIADARDFVTGIRVLDARAVAAGVTILSGASSVPALSSAVTDRLAVDMTRVSEIDIALSASNRASGGVSVTRAILSYVGRPLRLWRGQRWRDGFGWQEIGKVGFRVAGVPLLRRRVALCDVPDLDLLPARHAGRPATRFRAGTEIEFQNLALWLVSWPVRWGLVRDLTKLTGFGVTVQRLFQRFGGDRSAMRVAIKGWRGEQALSRDWTLIADRGDGPWIPAMAVPLLAAQLSEGLKPGARDAAGSLPLDSFEKLFARFSIVTGTQERRPEPLYARVMGEEFDQLPAAVRAMHLLNGDLGAHGTAQVVRGGSLGARLIGRAFGFPAAAAEVPVSVWMAERDGVETWRRDFGGACFASRMSQHGDLVVERFGAVRFAMKLKREPDGLSMPFQRWWIGPVPMPRAFLPRGVAREYVENGRFWFDVPIALPVIGPLVHYRGWLEIPEFNAWPG